MSSTDLRDHNRTRVHWRAAIRFPDGRKVLADVVNVSDGGVCLSCAHTAQVGQVLHVDIGVPDVKDHSKLHRVELDAKVTYQVLSGLKFQIGVQYTKIEDAVKSRIRAALVKSH